MENISWMLSAVKIVPMIPVVTASTSLSMSRLMCYSDQIHQHRPRWSQRGKSKEAI
jgi:hypothetical protein